MASFVTQISTEVISNISSKSYCTQISTEILSIPTGIKSQLTQAILETLHSGHASSYLTQLLIETLYPTPSSPTIPGFSSGTYQTIVAATSGIIAYYKLDETSGTTAVDSISAANGTYTGGYTLNKSSAYPLTLGKAVQLDGSTGYIACPTQSISGSISIECWIYYDTLPINGMIVEKEPINTQWELFFESGILNWRGGSTTALVLATSPSIHSWHHLVVTQNGTTAKIYVDGVLLTTGTVTAIGNGSGLINIGRYNSGYYLNAIIDEVAIYNVELSQATINSHLTQTALGTTPYSLTSQIVTETIYNSSVNQTNVSQIATETVYNSSVNQTKISQFVIETLYNVPSISLISQFVLETLYSGHASSYLTQLLIETLYSTPTAPSIPSNNALTTQLVLEIVKGPSVTAGPTGTVSISSYRSGIGLISTYRS